MRSSAPKLLAALVALTVLSTGGCSLLDGNPIYYRQWKADEEYGITFHQRIAELERIARDAGRLGDRTAATCGELANLYRLDKDPLIREEVVRTAAEIDHPAVDEILAEAIKDEDAQVRIAACRALRQRGGNRSLSALLTVMRTENDFDVRIEAVRALGEFRDREAVEALGEALEDRDPAMQLRAMASLRDATGEDYGNSVPAWRKFLAGETPEPPSAPSISRLIRNLF